eukprot:TRINITY_DN18168_c0_g2_i1.p1 TRINITY_DN18168_c0_g2~~TRINITY_DN18168_c0_g2_i1.p1  ORF type:complete len:245 (+),score=38.64 TRINITY_DN18168_c0_g2_i1:56-790(+)
MANEIEHVKATKSDYYAMFNIPKTATAEEINKAYKKLAFQLHPDKNSHKDAEDLFKLVGSAKKILLDPEKRNIYDTKGEVSDQEAMNIPLPVFVAGVLEWIFKGTVYQESREQPHPDGSTPLPPNRSPAWHLVPIFMYIIVLLVAVLQPTSDIYGVSLQPDSSAGITTPTHLTSIPFPFYTTQETHLAIHRSEEASAKAEDAVMKAYNKLKRKRCAAAKAVSLQMKDRGVAGSEAHIKSVCSVV